MRKSQLFDIPTYQPIEPAAEHTGKPAPSMDSDHAAEVIAAVEVALQSLRKRSKTFHVFPVNVPAASTGFMVQLPDVYDRLTFVFRPVTPAAFSFGPEGSSLTLNAFLGVVTFPGTVNVYMFNNPGAAYSFQVIGVRGYEQVEIREFI